MFGPKPIGFWSTNAEARWQCLQRGRRYRVRTEFVDFDGDTHAVGEEWEFAGSSYLPYDAGLSLFVLIADDEWYIPLQVSARNQNCIATHIDRYVEEIPS